MNQPAENRPDHMNEDDLRRALKEDRARLSEAEAGHRRELQAADRAGTEASFLRDENARLRAEMKALLLEAEQAYCAVGWERLLDALNRARIVLATESEGDPT